MGDIRLTGDASGGTVSLTFLADGNFLYRAELILLTVGSSTTTNGDIITAHRSLADRSGRSGISQLNWVLQRSTGATFATYTLSERDLPMVKRIPFGRTDQVAAQQLIAFNSETNINLATYDYSVVFSYWRGEALFLPGFLQSFWEAPVVAGP